MPKAARTHLGHKKVRYENKPVYSKLYHTRRWINQSRLYRKRNPLCVECLKHGITTDCTGKRKGAVDHIIPHRGDMKLFWDKNNNWQTLCTMHHNQKSAKEKL